MGIFLTLLGIVVLVCGVALAVYGLEGESRDASVIKKVSGAVLALIGLIVGTIGLSMTTVDARSVGIETKGGKYVDTLEPGRHLVAPWASVEPWTTRNQTMVFEGTDGSDGDNRWDQAAVPVRLASQGNASIDVTVTWAIADADGNFTVQKDRIQQLWKANKSFDDMAKNVAIASIVGITGDVFSTYNPFAALDTKNADNPYIDNSEWSKRINDKLNPEFARFGLTLVAVRVTFVHYDPDTENKLKALAGKVADTRNAEQEVKLAEQQALASAARANQSAKGCEALIRDLAAANQLQNLPPAFNCGGAGGGILVGTK